MKRACSDPPKGCSFLVELEFTVAPQVRAHVERQIDLVARGEAAFSAVVAHTLAQLQTKFAFFTSSIARMDELFEATFTSLAATGTAQAYQQS